MPLFPLSASGQEVLHVHGAMLLLLGAIYGGSWLLQSVMLSFLLVAVALLWGLLDLMLMGRALAIGQLRLALVYGILTLGIAYGDWWLLQQFQ
ncbi:hypothetical protein [Hymenobacter sp. YC55]|uniref:hypothetical protein n=1 Tax=Hymenobacter sp. YC55 TaxID=3034019 RepID=UPI0023F6A1CC|nr:hypothetical protein [Hymenobacter sp. YC55]MDF7813827.1 hypothetical protein [Hymenobacter sp. YC55]